MPRRQSGETRTPSEQLDLFVARSSELFDRRIARTGALESSLSLEFDQSKASISAGQPDEEDLRSFLITYRQFVSESEPIYVNKVRNLLTRSFDSSNEFSEHLATAHQLWTRHCKQGMVSLKIDGRAFNPLLLQDLLINGHYFHNDERKQRELASLSEMGKLFAQFGFMDSLVFGTRYVGYLSQVIQIGRSEGSLTI